jgi:Tol biopolymer transport system component
LDYQKNPVPSPDGAWIFYWSSVAEGGAGSGRWDLLTASRLMRLPSSGGPPEQVLEVPADDVAAKLHCSPRSGGICVLSRSGSGELFFYEVDPAHGQGKQLAKTKLSVPAILDDSWVVSADGARIAMVGGGELRGKIRVLDLKQGTERNLQLPNDWYIYDLCWTADGKALLAAAQTTSYFLARVELDGKSRLLLDRGRNGWLGWPVLSPDGRHLAFHQLTFDSNAWLLENF